MLRGSERDDRGLSPRRGSGWRPGARSGGRWCPRPRSPSWRRAAATRRHGSDPGAACAPPRRAGRAPARCRTPPASTSNAAQTPLPHRSRPPRRCAGTPSRPARSPRAARAGRPGCAAYRLASTSACAPAHTVPRQSPTPAADFAAVARLEEERWRGRLPRVQERNSVERLGDGSFAAPTGTNGGGVSVDLAVADLDGDGVRRLGRRGARRPRHRR